MDTVKIFVKNNCPRCPVAKKLYDELASRLDSSGVTVEKWNVDETEGLVEAAMHMVLTTPTVLVFDGEENKVADWRAVVPSPDEVIEALNIAGGEHAPVP